MGLIMGALPSVAFGALSVLMPPSAFIRRPLAWLRAIDSYRGTHGYSPNFGYDLCVERTTAEERAGLDLSTMRIWVNGAEMVRKPTGDRFLEAFAASNVRPESYTPSYGLAESTVLVSTARGHTSGLVVWVDSAALERDDVVLAGEGDPGARPLCSDGLPGPGYDVGSSIRRARRSPSQNASARSGYAGRASVEAIGSGPRRPKRCSARRSPATAAGPTCGPAISASCTRASCSSAGARRT